ncbi:MAG: hypothetical protein EOO39_51230, partial [Cytophagaceae bacterium]
MKRLLYFLLLGPLVWIDTACTDTCTETRVFRQYTPVSLTTNQVRMGLNVANARGLVNPGKIYTKDGYLFINELKMGIHIIDNRDPANPKPVAFINIPGNGDMAVRDNFLYADSYMDLVTLDISNLTDIHEVARSQNVFTQGQFDGGSWYYSPTNSNELIQDQKVDYIKQTVKTNCEASPASAGTWWGGGWNTMQFASASFDSKSAAPSNGTSGTGGSMARFALYEKYLYAVSTSEMKLFNVQQPAKPTFSSTV